MIIINKCYQQRSIVILPVLHHHRHEQHYDNHIHYCHYVYYCIMYVNHLPATVTADFTAKNTLYIWTHTYTRGEFTFWHVFLRFYSKFFTRFLNACFIYWTFLNKFGPSTYILIITFGPSTLKFSLNFIPCNGWT